MAVHEAPNGRSSDEAARLQKRVTELQQAMAGLRESGDLLQAVLDASEGVIFAKDMEGRYVLANPAFSRLFNRSLEEILGKKDEDLFPSEEAAQLRARDSEILKTGRTLRSVDRLTIGGKERVFASTKVPLRDRSGRIIGISGFAADITDEIRVRDKLAHLNRTLRAIRAVNQLIARERNRDRLLRETCELLIETKGYDGAWIALLDGDRRLTAFFHAGLGDAASSLHRMLRDGELPECARRALAQSKAVMIEEPAVECGACPLLGKDPEHRELTAPLRYEERVYGVVSVSIPMEYAAAGEEQKLLSEVARDISFALHDIDLEEERQRVQEALRESEASYRSIVENSHAGILVVDDAHRFVYVNDELCRILDREREEIIGHDFREFLDEESRVLVADRYRRRQAGEDVPSRYEFNVIRKDGAKRRVEISSTVIRDSMGRVRTIAQILDITDRVQAEDRLKESEEKYRSLIEDVLDSSDVGIFILDSNFKVVWINQALERYFGLKRDEVVGRDKRELIRTRIKDIFADPDGFAEKVLATYENNTYIEHFECHVLPGPGREECWLDHWSQPIRSGLYAGGRVEHYTDITARKRLEIGIRESEEQVRLIIETSPDAIFTVDSRGRFLSVNPIIAKELGYSRDELLHMSLTDVILPEYISQFKDRFARVLSGETLDEPGEYEVVGKDGRRIWIAVNSAPLRKDGEVIGFLGIARDITERVELQQRITAIDELTRTLILLRDRDEIIRRVIEATKSLLGMTDCASYLIDEAAGKLLIAGYTKDVPARFNEMDLASEKGIIPAVARSGEAIYLPDVSKDKRYLAGRSKTRSELCVPIKVGDRIFGVLNAERPALDGFTPADRELLAALADSTAVALENLRLNAETAALKEFNERIITTINEGIIIENASGTITYVNPAGAEILGYSPPELIGKRWTSLIPEEEQAAIEAKMPERRAGASDRYETVLLTKEGTRLPIILSASPLFEDGEYAGTVSAFTDITKRVRAENALAESYAKASRTLDGIIAALEAAIDLRDPYTAGHQSRVARLAVAIAEEMNLPEEKVDAIRYAALVHDIGKLAVPAEILAKPSKLSDTEFEIIKAHPGQAHSILKGIDFPWPVADIVLQHHERLDGSGYPQGLKGDEILLEARILAVADVVEAMASHRPYRPARGIEAALAEIERNKGRLYDPTVVSTCLELFTKKGFTFD